MARQYDIRPKYRNKKRITYKKPYKDLAPSTKRHYRAKIDQRPKAEKRLSPIDTIPAAQREQVIRETPPPVVYGTEAPSGTGEKRSRFGRWLSEEEFRRAKFDPSRQQIGIYDTYFFDGGTPFFTDSPRGHELAKPGGEFRSYKVGVVWSKRDALNYDTDDISWIDPEMAQFEERRFIIVG